MILMTRRSTRLYCGLRLQSICPRQCVYQQHKKHINLESCKSSYPRWSTLIPHTNHSRQLLSKHLCVICQCQVRQYASLSSLLCCPLPSRTVIKIKGRDSANFLQGLITNDMNLLSLKQPAIYTMMLNVQGRVLYDMIIYVLPPENEELVYLIECDIELATELMQTMNKYKIRKKVSLALAGDEFKISALLPVSVIRDAGVPSVHKNNDAGIIINTPDPRLPQLGYRLLTKADQTVSELLAKEDEMSDEITYTKRRYMLGMSEGPLDLPPGNCTPLESNGDILSGVSFSKGCYIGQELTARTHYTGVVRKRLVPIILHGDATQLNPGTTIENQKGKNCGKYRNAVGSHGLALIRLQDITSKDRFLVKGNAGENVADIEAIIPWWWPRDSDKIINQVLAILEKEI